MSPAERAALESALERFRSEVPDGMHVTLVVIERDTTPDAEGLHKHQAFAWTADIYPRDLGDEVLQVISQRMGVTS